MSDAFSGHHPIVCFTYFALVLGFSMSVMQPLFLAVGFLSACAYCLYLALCGHRFRTLFWLVIAVLVAGLLNPLFNHRGATILAYFSNGNPLTLESLYFGAASSAMFAAVLIWFLCFGAVMTTDRLMCLLGRAAPSLALLLSMSLRFLPRFRAHAEELSAAQRGKLPARAGLIARIRHGIRLLSALVTWAFESSATTADSMRARAYGTARRTSFELYKFTRRDFSALVFLLVTGIYTAIGAISGAAAFSYFPHISAIRVDAYAVSVLTAYFLMCITPVAINITEGARWKRIQSKI